MATVDDNDLYPIGDVARRTGLSVSAIRFYADAGIIAPTDHTEAGYRLYDIQAIARLELVRTLRELDASLDDIRQLLANETSLRELATTHLELVERQMRRLHARRAVLRTIVKQHSATEQVSLMHKLVSMSDDDRDRLIDEFWSEVTEGLEVASPLVERLRNSRPNLSAEPTAEQLEAWIELADMVQDNDFRASVRTFVHETLNTDRARFLATPAQAEQRQRREALFREAQAAYDAGLAADSPQAQDIANRFVASVGASFEGQGTDVAELRRRMADFDSSGEAGQEISKRVTRYAKLLGRYTDLVETINGTRRDKERDTAAGKWLMTAVKGPYREPANDH